MAENVIDLRAAREKYQGDIKRLLAGEYDHGFRIGEIVGANRMQKIMREHHLRAVGAWFLTGMGCGVVVACLAAGILR